MSCHCHLPDQWNGRTEEGSIDNSMTAHTSLERTTTPINIGHGTWHIVYEEINTGVSV